jgi:hypothetical protein
MGSNGRQRPEPLRFHVAGYRLAYGFASLSCTLPIFLAVVGASLTASGPGGMAVMFAAYAAGMATVLMSVALGAALFKDAVAQWFRRFMPYVHRLGAILLIGAGRQQKCMRPCDATLTRLRPGTISAAGAIGCLGVSPRIVSPLCPVAWLLPAVPALPGWPPAARPRRRVYSTSAPSGEASWRTRSLSPAVATWIRDSTGSLFKKLMVRVIVLPLAGTGIGAGLCLLHVSAHRFQPVAWLADEIKVPSPWQQRIEEISEFSAWFKLAWQSKGKKQRA